MKHFASPEFWALYRALPQPVQNLTDKYYSLLKNNPHHPSLHMKKVGRFWSVRIGLHYRAVAVEAPGGIPELTQRINSVRRLKKYAGMSNINL